MKKFTDDSHQAHEVAAAQEHLETIIAIINCSRCHEVEGEVWVICDEHKK